MSNALTIPEAAEVPAYALNPELAKEMNADAAAGISTGFPARIKLSAKEFILVDGSGAETPVKVGDLFLAEDGNAYLPTVVLRAKKEIQKAWYATKFNPSEDGKAPDCFSNDGLTPASSVAAPQCETCAGCAQNAWGSGTDQNGNATAGKACSDSKIIAVFCKGSVYKLKMPPASLKNWGLYVKELTNRGIPVGNVKTLLGFDSAQSYSVLTFSFGGFIAEAQLPKLAALSQSSEAEDIVTETITASTKTTPAIENKPVAKAKPAVKKVEPVAAADGLGLDDPPGGGVAGPAKEEPVVVAEVESTPDEASLADELGL
jgi:hypothetical protein